MRQECYNSAMSVAFESSHYIDRSEEQFDFSALAEEGSRRLFNGGEKLYEKGDNIGEIFLLIRGAVVKVAMAPNDSGVQNKVYLDLVEPGRLLGLEGINTDEKYFPNHDATVISPQAEVIAVSSKIAAKLMKNTPFALNILRGAALELRRRSERIAVMEKENNEDKILSILRMLAKRHGVVHGDHTLIPLKLTDRDIGRLAGMLWRENVSRAKKKLRQNGVVWESKNSGIEFRDAPQQQIIPLGPVHT